MKLKEFLKSDRKIIVASFLISLLPIINFGFLNCPLRDWTDVVICNGPLGLVGDLINELLLLPALPLIYMTTLIMGKTLTFAPIDSLLIFVYSVVSWYMVFKIVSNLKEKKRR